jgi:hypothetical protein
MDVKQWRSARRKLTLNMNIAWQAVRVCIGPRIGFTAWGSNQLPCGAFAGRLCWKAQDAARLLLGAVLYGQEARFLYLSLVVVLCAFHS